MLKNRVDKVYLFFDNDEAGKRATMRSLDILFAAHIPSYVVVNNKGKDPDELLKNNGVDSVVDMIKNAVTGFDYYVDEKCRGFNMSNPQEKAALFKSLADIFSKFEDKDAAAFYLQALRERLGVAGDAPLTTEKKTVKKEKSGVKTPYKADELLFFVFVLENKKYAREFKKIKDDLGYFFSGDTIRAEGENALEYALSCEGDCVAAKALDDQDVLREVSALMLGNNVDTGLDTFKRYYDEVIKKISFKKRSEVYFEKTMD